MLDIATAFAGIVRPLPMHMGLFTEGMGRLSFDDMLDTAAAMGIRGLEIGVGGWSTCPHIDVGAILDSEQARKTYLSKIEQRGMTLDVLNCSANPLEPGDRGKQHREDIYRSFELAEALGVDTIISQTGCPAGSAEDKCVNWITSSFPFENLDILKYQWEVSFEFWAGAVKKAAEHGVKKIAFENHPSNMVYNVRTMRIMRKELGEIVGMNLDPSHVFFMGGDPIEMARVLCQEKLVYHVHAKDCRINKSNRALDLIEVQPFWAPAAERAWNYVAVGYGHDHLWWKEFFATLAAGSYVGPVSIEVEDFLMSNDLMAIERSADFLRETMLK
ncbi:sugar phosphate isomerase/epimerase [Phyllobacterium sp. YR531]|uniref:sugar phosphate isomerase/epimerase family protein n=1 Tax=Phyllobacterium sp. YR531 TaxID=1144343 RepID=UPI00026FB1BD|nr:sugar phosphate isomerase/epimerase [Phyllobacterium sp. YR531]EJN06714.1 sugar phosphate isomerase/epimerase [Phyllobacterium sp. YR531]